MAVVAKSTTTNAQVKNISRGKPQISSTGQSHVEIPVIQQKSDCPCDGGCPRCTDDNALPLPPDSPPNRQVRDLKGGGLPLPETERGFFERRFGEDFSGVRVHDGAEAAKSAAELNAGAFTSGKDIVMGDRQYSPGTAEGRQLLAHELTHVLQQSRSTATPPIQTKRRRKRRKKKPFYHSVEQKLEKLKKKDKGELRRLQIKPYRFRGYEALLILCKELDKGEKASKIEVKKLLNRFLYFNERYALHILTEKIYLEISRRLYILGLSEESLALRTHFIVRANRITAKETEERYVEKGIYWKNLTDGIMKNTLANPKTKCPRYIRVWLRLLGDIQLEKKKLPTKELKYIDPNRQSIQVSGYREGSKGEYFIELSKMMAQAVTGFNLCFQPLMDKTVSALEKQNKGAQAALINIETLINEAIAALKIDPRTETPKIEITKTRFAKEMAHRDFFDQKKKKDLPITFYNVHKEPDEGSEKELKILSVLETRKAQVTFLKNFFGPTNKASLSEFKSGTGKDMQLNNVDHWRRWAVIKYNRLVKNKKEKKVGKKGTRVKQGTDITALFGVIRLLESYMKAFTIGTPYNVVDSGGSSANYLKRSFPRALTGQLIHDCGVYALRIAYILSSLMSQLNLKMQYILMPNHMGLIISGSQKDSPLIFVHNNSFHMYYPSTWQLLKKRWKAWQPPQSKQKGQKGQKGPRAPQPDRSDEQFRAELSTKLFYRPHLDMPVKTVDIKPPGNIKKTWKARKHQDNMWKKYKKMAEFKLFKDVKEDDPGYQFNLEYLDVLEKYKKFNNTYVVPFWYETAAKLFKTFESDARRAANNTERKAARKKYIFHLWDEKKKVDAKLKEFYDHCRDISSRYRNIKAIHVPGTRVTVGERVDPIVDQLSYQKVIHKHAKNTLGGTFSLPVPTKPRSVTEPKKSSPVPLETWKIYKKEIDKKTSEELFQGQQMIITVTVIDNKFFKKSPFVSTGKDDPVFEME